MKTFKVFHNNSKEHKKKEIKSSSDIEQERCYKCWKTLPTVI